MKLLKLLSLVLALQQAWAAPSLTLSSSTVAADSTATVVHTISGLANGETVLVERIADLNSDGIIQPTEPSFRSFKVTDGVRPTFGGIVNQNVPGDDDAAVNGTIRVDLFLPGVDPILNRAVSD